MRQEIYNQVKDFNKALYTASKQMMNINVRTHERLIQEQFAVISECLEGSVKQLEMFRDATDIPDYLTAQVEQLHRCSEHLKVFFQENMNILSDTRDEIISWSNEGLSEMPSLSSVPPSETT